jgi:hypothetical protein
MRVSQLIEQLMNFTLDAEVVVRDREGELVSTDIGVMPVHDHESNEDVVINLVLSDYLAPDLSHNTQEMIRQLARREEGITCRDVVDAGVVADTADASTRLAVMATNGLLNRLDSKRDGRFVYIKRN